MSNPLRLLVFIVFLLLSLEYIHAAIGFNLWTISFFRKKPLDVSVSSQSSTVDTKLDKLDQSLEKSVNYDVKKQINEKAITESREEKENWVLEENVKFFYYIDQAKRQLIQKGEAFETIDRVFDPNRPCVFITHGWQSKFVDNDWMERLKNLVFVHEITANVFIMDWSHYSNYYKYQQSALSTERVGKAMAHLLRYLITKHQLNPQRVQLIGHSLGAHVAGFAGKHLKAELDMQIGRITGLDPAGPEFLNVMSARRLDRLDAKFVQIIHSNMGNSSFAGLGSWERLGHVDVYINGGSRQPGCLSMTNGLSHDQVFNDKTNDDKNQKKKLLPRHLIRSHTFAIFSSNRIFQYLYCHHARSRRFFELMLNDNCQPVAYQCESYEKFQQGHCVSCGDHGERCILPIYLPEAKARQMANLKRNDEKFSYFVDTRDRTPLCVNHYQFKLSLAETSANSSRNIQMQLYGSNLKAKLYEFGGTFEAGNEYEFLVKSDPIDSVLIISANYSNTYKDYVWDREELQIKTLEINYMSHLDPSFRKNHSFKFCLKEREDNLNILTYCGKSIDYVFD